MVAPAVTGLKFTMVCEKLLLKGRLAGLPCRNKLPVAIPWDIPRGGIEVCCWRCEQTTVLE